MFSNVGSKIQTFAAVSCAIGIVLSILSGIALASMNVIVGIVTMIIGALLSWVGSLFLYGFGQLVENSDRMVKTAEQSLTLQKFCKDDLGILTEEAISKKDTL